MQQPDFREPPEWDGGGSRPSDHYRSNNTKDLDPDIEHPRNYKPYRPDESESYMTEVREAEAV